MKNIMKKIKNKKAFTLIEMVLVLFIISVLMLIIIPNLSGKQASIKTQGNEALQTVVQAQADMYELDTGGKAATIGLLETEKYLTEKQSKQASALFEINAEGEVIDKTGTP